MKTSVFRHFLHFYVKIQPEGYTVGLIVIILCLSLIHCIYWHPHRKMLNTILNFKIQRSKNHSCLWIPSTRLSCMRLMTKCRHAKKSLWKQTSIPWKSPKTPICWARPSWAAPLLLGKDSWSTRGGEIYPIKQVRAWDMVWNVLECDPSIQPSHFVHTFIYVSVPPGKYMSTVTEFGCIPVSTMYQTEQYGWVVVR